jgi:hypothetical protein
MPVDIEQSGKSRIRDEISEIPEEITCPVLGNLPEKWEKMPEEW